MKYIFPIVAVIALILGVIGLVPNKVLGGQYTTNHQYFDGVTNSGTLTQTGAVALTGKLTLTGDVAVSDDVAIAGSLCVLSGGLYYTLVPATSSLTMTTSTASCL